ncbi:MAG: hypothetical protein QW175_07830 [Candidatus Bathyarchaeia archaeon]
MSDVKWTFEYRGVVCKRFRDGRLGCGLCNCAFFSLNDLNAHLNVHKKEWPTSGMKSILAPASLLTDAKV